MWFAIGEISSKIFLNQQPKRNAKRWLSKSFFCLAMRSLLNKNILKIKIVKYWQNMRKRSVQNPSASLLFFVNFFFCHLTWRYKKPYAWSPENWKNFFQKFVIIERTIFFYVFSPFPHPPPPQLFSHYGRNRFNRVLIKKKNKPFCPNLAYYSGHCTVDDLTTAFVFVNKKKTKKNCSAETDCRTFDV